MAFVTGSSSDRVATLRRVLWLDAATCLATGLLLALASTGLSRVLGLPAALCFESGLILLLTALFIAFVAWREPLWRGGVLLVVAGNGLWVLASLWLAGPGAVAQNILGLGFILAQAVVVAGLAVVEGALLSRGA